MNKASSQVRYGEVERETKETKVSVVLDLDGGQSRGIETGIGFLDHMLELFAFHGLFSLGVKAEGDRHIDDHHTVEDVGIAMGQAMREALKDAHGIVRYGDTFTPMDEALVQIALDISGRGVLVYDCPFQREFLGVMATENVREFLRAFASHAGMTLHVRRIAGENDHHVAEAIFKGLGRSLYCATRYVDRQGPPSTKGTLD
ncbi:MAG: imidazoleglycerol-phosphate dehydratase HisB [Fimbriimonadaceae bacterium]|nr:imidazoleglycerol-phosphate dehydratase HisB [Fimbriimonadaceae bacterium]